MKTKYRRPSPSGYSRRTFDTFWFYLCGSQVAITAELYHFPKPQSDEIMLNALIGNTLQDCPSTEDNEMSADIYSKKPLNFMFLL